ncbi:MAG: hypothetical protein WA843_00535 [Candidatus Saccharimonadales bacterium]
MHNAYLIEPSSVGALRSKHVLLDTNFLIDASIFKEEAAELIVQLRDLSCDLVTTKAVVVETLGGTTDETALRKKTTYLESVFGQQLDHIVSLPIERDLPTPNDLLAFSRQCNKFSNTDFELFLTLKKYKPSDILLITRNHKDFTDKICDRVGFITLLGNKEIRTYGVYRAK